MMLAAGGIITGTAHWNTWAGVILRQSKLSRLGYNRLCSLSQWMENIYSTYFIWAIAIIDSYLESYCGSETMWWVCVINTSPIRSGLSCQLRERGSSLHAPAETESYLHIGPRCLLSMSPMLCELQSCRGMIWNPIPFPSAPGQQ